MNPISFLKAFSLLILLFGSVIDHANAFDDAATASALKEFEEARFGLFIHWGVYSVPAGEYQGKRYKKPNKEHIMLDLKIPRMEYRELAKQFNPVMYDANAWVKLAKDAGMKYIVITAKHHDGFALFDSEFNDFDIVDGTPYGKDVLADLAEACRKEDMKLGFYYSHARDWDEEHSVSNHGNTWDFPDESKKNPDIYIQSKVKQQLKELLTNYGDVFVLWFDTPIPMSYEQSEEIYGWVKESQPACLVNTRLGNGLGDYSSMGDNQIPPGRIGDGGWETPATMNNTWGYCFFDEDWKSAESMIRQLVDLSSKGLNYLLNVGPMADGVIPEPSVERLKAIGAWMKVNNEAIYGTDPSPYYQEFDWGRITSRPDKLYLSIFDTQDNEIYLHHLKNKVFAVSHLGSGSPIDFTFAEGSLKITIPDSIKRETVPVLVVDIEGGATVDDNPVQMSNGHLSLPVGIANIHREKGELSIAGSDGFTDVGEFPHGASCKWTDARDYLSWDVTIIEPGSFRIKVISAAMNRNMGKHLRFREKHYKTPDDLAEVSVTVAGQSVRGKLDEAEQIKNFRSKYRPTFSSAIGEVDIDKAGEYQVVMRAEHLNSNDPLGLIIYGVRMEAGTTNRYRGKK